MIRAQGLDAAVNFLRAAPTLAQGAVNSAMQSGEYVGALRQLAERAIHASVPTSHEYLIPVLTRLVDHDSTRGMMKFWVSAASLSEVNANASDAELVDFVQAISPDDILYWVEHFKEIKGQDIPESGEIDYERIASRVEFAVKNKPQDWIHPNRKESSLLHVSGAMGTSLSDTEIVSGALENVLAAWTRYLLRVVPDQIAENLRTQLP